MGTRHGRRAVLLALALLPPAIAAGAATPVGDARRLIRAGLALACDAGVSAAAMADGFGGEARVLDDRALEMGGESFGWRRRFAVGAGIVSVVRLAPWGTLRRIEVRDDRVSAPGPRPTMIAIAGPDCAVVAARRLVHGATGRAVAIEPLSATLAPAGPRLPLDPPVPPGTDPGGVTVALVDSGVNYLLPIINAALARDDAGRALGQDFWDLDPCPFDADPARSPFFPQRHGTRVASVILAEGPRLRLIPYRYPRPDPARWPALIDDAATKGARVLNLAMGSNRPDAWGAFAEAARARPEILFVVSAGNDGRDIDRKPVYPAAFAIANMLVIGSADGFGDPAPGSNWGKGTVDLLVPGERIVAIGFDGAPTLASGTSFATPRVTALAARLLTAHPDWDTARLKAAIIARARMSDAGGPPTSRYGVLDPGS